MDRDREYVEYVSARLPALHRAAYLLCGDPHQADDIVSATTTALYRHWHRVREADNVDAYVHRTLVRKYVDERRMRWARVLLTDRVPERSGGHDGHVEERDSLRLALAQLTTAQRTVLVLRFDCRLVLVAPDRTTHRFPVDGGKVRAVAAAGTTLAGFVDPTPVTWNCTR